MATIRPSKGRVSRQYAICFLAIFLFSLPHVFHNTALACTLIVVGKKASIDGSVMIAHSDDAGGETSDIRLLRVEAADHPKGSKRAVLRVKGGFPRIVAEGRGKAYLPKNNPGEPLTEVLGYIDQVPHTFAYIDQDYGMINEKQLIIGETTTGGRFAGWPKSPSAPWGNSWFGIEELSKIAMERCETARCAIQTMGGLAYKYGFYSEESGEDPENPELTFATETLAIGDKFGEVRRWRERATGLASLPLFVLIPPVPIHCGLTWN